MSGRSAPPGQVLGPPQVGRVGDAGVAVHRPLDRQQAAGAEQLGLDVGRRAAAGAAQLHRPVEQALGRLERVAAHGHLGGPLERLGRPVADADRRRGPQVLGQDLGGVVAVADRRPRGRRPPAGGCGPGAARTRRRRPPRAPGRGRSGTCPAGRAPAPAGGARRRARGRRGTPSRSRRPTAVAAGRGRRRARSPRPPAAADGGLGQQGDAPAHDVAHARGHVAPG